MNNTSELCVRCGLCCVVLHAECSWAEAQTLCEEMGVDPEKFVDTQEYLKLGEKIRELVDVGLTLGKDVLPAVRAARGSESQVSLSDDSKLRMRFPCMFLRGRVGKGVLCTAYGRSRPKVCGSYLCRIATQYRIGELSLAEGLLAIQRAFWINEPGAFNWTGSDQERRLIVREMVEVVREEMQADGLEDWQINLHLADRLTPRYFAKSDLDGGLLNMHFAAHDRRMTKLKGELDPHTMLEGLRLYLDDQFLKSLDLDSLRLAGVVMSAVLTELRSFLTTENEAEEQDRLRKERLCEGGAAGVADQGPASADGVVPAGAVQDQHGDEGRLDRQPGVEDEENKKG